MKHKAYIFDFDGTLVHSNAIKREAFYNLSPEIIGNKAAVDKILSLIPEKSRFEIVKAIYALIEKETGKKFEDEEVKRAIDKYSSLVWEGVSTCPELEGATQLLSALKQSGSLIYISSNTPEDSLRDLIAGRDWLKYLDGCFGFPKLKAETVKFILNSKKLSPDEVIVVGDGESDEISASANDCHFYKILHPKGLVEFRGLINSTNLYV